MVAISLSQYILRAWKNFELQKGECKEGLQREKPQSNLY